MHSTVLLCTGLSLLLSTCRPAAALMPAGCLETSPVLQRSVCLTEGFVLCLSIAAACMPEDLAHGLAYSGCVSQTC